MIVVAKNNQNFSTGEGLDHGKVVGTQLNAAGVGYTLLPWLPLFFFVKYEQEEAVEYRQTKELSRERKICCLCEVVVGCYDCFACTSLMYRNISLLK